MEIAFNVWDKIVIDKVVTVEELIETFSNQYNIIVNSIYINNV